MHTVWLVLGRITYASAKAQGLGKTITGLALVLKSRGCLPAPPPGAHVVQLPPADGRPAAYYTLPASAASAAAPPHARSGRRASLRSSASAGTPGKRCGVEMPRGRAGGEGEAQAARIRAEGESIGAGHISPQPASSAPCGLGGVGEEVGLGSAARVGTALEAPGADLPNGRLGAASAGPPFQKAGAGAPCGGEGGVVVLPAASSKLLAASRSSAAGEPCAGAEAAAAQDARAVLGAAAAAAWEGGGCGAARCAALASAAAEKSLGRLPPGAARASAAVGAMNGTGPPAVLHNATLILDSSFGDALEGVSHAAAAARDPSPGFAGSEGLEGGGSGARRDLSGHPAASLDLDVCSALREDAAASRPGAGPSGQAAALRCLGARSVSFIDASASGSGAGLSRQPAASPDLGTRFTAVHGEAAASVSADGSVGGGDSSPVAGGSSDNGSCEEPARKRKRRGSSGRDASSGRATPALRGKRRRKGGALQALSTFVAEPQTWVACDLCDAWRVLPVGHAVWPAPGTPCMLESHEGQSSLLPEMPNSHCGDWATVSASVESTCLLSMWQTVRCTAGRLMSAITDGWWLQAVLLVLQIRRPYAAHSLDRMPLQALKMAVNKQYH